MSRVCAVFVPKQSQLQIPKTEGGARQIETRSFYEMPAAVTRHRVFLLATSGVLYPAILGTFLLAERPGLGIGHFYYFPVAMIALASGPVWGVLAGVGRRPSFRRPSA